MNTKRLAVLACLTASPLVAAGQQYRWDVEGLLTEADALTFAVINGSLQSSNPEPNDLPLAFTGTLELDFSQQTGSFEFEGDFVSPSRSYTFDVFVGDVFGGFSILNLGTGLVQIDDDFADFDFALTIASSGFGEFAWSDPDGLPTSPPSARTAEGTILSSTFTIIPEPSTAALAIGVSLAAICGPRSRRR